MPNYLQVPVIDDMKASYAYDLGRELRPGDVFMMNKAPILSSRSFMVNGGKTVQVGCATSPKDINIKSLDVTGFYSDYLFLVALDASHVIAPFCTGTTEGTSTGIRPYLGDSGRTDLNQYNCTAPIVEVSGVSGNDLSASVPDVTELVDGLFFIMKVPPNSHNVQYANRTLNVNGTGAKYLRKYTYVTTTKVTTKFSSGSAGGDSSTLDTYYPVLYSDTSFYVLSNNIYEDPYGTVD